MTRCSVLSLLTLCLSLSVAADDLASVGPRALEDAASDADESEFRDPFDADPAARAPAAPIADPLERVNRVFFKFNDKLYFWILKPVSKAYGKVAPEPFRQSIRRAFVNARYPIRLVNNLLQAKFKGAGVETARFFINSTVGIGGLFDPAHEEWRLQPSPEDLDQTLGFYKLPMGIYFNWPVFGPSSVRGTVGTIGDSFLSPWNYLDNVAVVYGTRLGDTVNATSLRLGEYESFLESAFDPYISLRNAYVENRRSLVSQ
jgi:phospholipid-binding lipoprotein MlaA